MNNYTAVEYIYMNIADCFGLDKQSFEDKIEWVKTNINNLSIFKENISIQKQYKLYPLMQAIQNPDQPTGVMVELDACASGITLMSCLMNDPIGAINTGLIGSKPKDIYMAVTTRMNKLLNSDTHYDRKTVKPAIMTVFYGSKAKPKEVFGINTPELKAFYQAIQELCPGAWTLLQIIKQYISINTTEYNWKLPDNFQVVTPVLNKVTKKIEIDEFDHKTFSYTVEIPCSKEFDVSLIANIIHSIDGFIIRELNRRCNYSKQQLLTIDALIQRHLNQNNNIKYNKIEMLWEKTNFDSLVGIDYITPTNISLFSKDYLYMMHALINETLQHPSFEIINIHDAVRFHPNYGNIIRKVYIDIMAEIAESTILETILDGFDNKFPYNIDNAIRCSNYLLM